jgi:hypothetical protein
MEVADFMDGAAGSSIHLLRLLNILAGSATSVKRLVARLQTSRRPAGYKKNATSKAALNASLPKVCSLIRRGRQGQGYSASTGSGDLLPLPLLARLVVSTQKARSFNLKGRRREIAGETIVLLSPEASTRCEREEKMTRALLKLLSAKLLPKALGDILSGIFGSGLNPNLAGRIQDMLEKRLEEQQGRTGARFLARAVLEQIDALMEDGGVGSVEEREKIVTELAQNGALQLTQAAELLLKYPPLQAAVVKAKQPGATAAALQAAREERNALAERVKQALIDVGRVVAGDKPREL